MPSRILRLWNPDASAWEEVGDSRLTAHLAAADPHPTYLTAAEGDALFLTQAEGDARYAAIGGGGGGSMATDALWDAKGDLAAGTGANAGGRLALGTDGQVLTADSAQALGVKWATPTAGGGGSGGGMVRIQETTLASDTASVVFSAIPGTYRSLVLYVVGRSAAAGTGTDDLLFRFNNDASPVYDQQWLHGSGSTSTSGNVPGQDRGFGGLLPRAGNTAAFPGFVRLEVGNYASTQFSKAADICYSAKTATTSAGQVVGRLLSTWRTASAVTRIDVYAGSGSLAAGTWVALYGVDGGASAGLDAYTKAESDAAFLSPTEGDAAYLKLTGGTLTGNLGVGVAPAAGVAVTAGGSVQTTGATGAYLFASRDGGDVWQWYANQAGGAQLYEQSAAYNGNRVAVSRTGTLTVTPDAGQEALRATLAGGASVFLTGGAATNGRVGAGGAGASLECYAPVAVVPFVHNALACGTSALAWSVVHSIAGVSQTSLDEAKETITPLPPEDALAAVRATDPVTFSYKPPERPPEWYELPDDPEQAARVLEQRMTAAPLEEGARHQAGVVLGHDTFRTDPLFQTGEGLTNASNGVGILIGAVKALLARVEALEGA